MMKLLKSALAALIAASLVSPAIAAAKYRPEAKARGRNELRIVVRPKGQKYREGRYGFLPGYRQPPYIAEWRDRSPQFGGGDYTNYPYERRFWSGGEWRYGWGGPGFYRGRWNGGTFGPCYTRTPIGPVWNCGM
jgi:hypothetical protein